MQRSRASKPVPAAKPGRSARSAAKPPADQREVQTALATLAHEVRTPLNGILVLAELLANSDLPPREREWVSALRRAAEHLASLTTLVVDGARADAGMLQPRPRLFCPSELANAIATALVARAASKGLEADVAIAADLPPKVLGDPVLIRAALENLVDNAVKFTEQGRIGFALDHQDAGDVSWRLIFSLTDEGVGLSQSEIRRLFRPFAQANARIGERYGGAGLGLAFARQMARALGGDLFVSSVPGEGSCFRLEVLVASPSPSPSNEDLSVSRSSEDVPSRRPVRPLRILCAEDNPFGRTLFNAMLAPLGHRLDFVASGEAAVTAAESGGYDLILMDVTLSGIDGIEAARRIRALEGPAGATPIVGISGRSGGGDEASARAAGMNAYLVKPVSTAMLIAALGAAA